VRRLTAGVPIEYLGALLMATDEVVLHTFRAADAQLVARIAAEAGLAFDRVVESVEVLPSRRGTRRRGNRIAVGRGNVQPPSSR
jgi:hypothetical protein